MYIGIPFNFKDKPLVFNAQGKVLKANEMAKNIIKAHQGFDVKALVAYETTTGEKRYISAGNTNPSERGRAYAFKPDGSEVKDDKLANALQKAYTGSDIIEFFPVTLKNGQTRYVSLGNHGKFFAFKNNGKEASDVPLLKAIKANFTETVYSIFPYRSDSGEMWYICMGDRGQEEKTLVFGDNGNTVKNDPVVQSLESLHMMGPRLFDYEVNGETRIVAVEWFSGRAVALRNDGSVVENDALAEGIKNAKIDMMDFVFTSSMGNRKIFISVGGIIKNKSFAFGQDQQNAAMNAAEEAEVKSHTDNLEREAFERFIGRKAPLF